MVEGNIESVGMELGSDEGNELGSALSITLGAFEFSKLFDGAMDCFTEGSLDTASVGKTDITLVGGCDDLMLGLVEVDIVGDIDVVTVGSSLLKVGDCVGNGVKNGMGISSKRGAGVDPSLVLTVVGALVGLAL